MKKIGFIKSNKENENRRAITYNDIKKVKHKEFLVFEENYFDVFGISDSKIKELGCSVVSRDEVLKCDVICDPKIGDADYLNTLQNQTIFGWVHATQNKHITDIIIEKSLTAYAWEDMFDEEKHIFWLNNQIAGEAAVLHSILLFGKLPSNMKAAILGYGNTAKGAHKILKSLGADVVIYRRKDEEKFKKEFSIYDIIVNAVLWDTNRNDYILSNNDLDKMKRDSLIIDISCDHDGAIESCHPTTVEDPTYIHKGIFHYAVDHTPTLLYKDATEAISNEVVKYLDLFIENKEDTNSILSDALIIEDGLVIDERINIYQKRN